MNETTQRLIESLERLERLLPMVPNSTRSDGNNSASLHVSAGGAGAWAAAWIASICCTACLVAMVLGGMWMLHQAKQIDDLNAYLQAIYQQAPSLQPKEASK